MPEEKQCLEEVTGAAVTIQNGIATILIRREDFAEKIELSKDDFSHAFLTRDQYIHELELIPKPYIMNGRLKGE